MNALYAINYSSNFLGEIRDLTKCKFSSCPIRWVLKSTEDYEGVIELTNCINLIYVIVNSLLRLQCRPFCMKLPAWNRRLNSRRRENLADAMVSDCSPRSEVLPIPVL